MTWSSESHLHCLSDRVVLLLVVWKANIWPSPLCELWPKSDVSLPSADSEYLDRRSWVCNFEENRHVERAIVDQAVRTIGVCGMWTMNCSSVCLKIMFSDFNRGWWILLDFEMCYSVLKTAEIKFCSVIPNSGFYFNLPNEVAPGGAQVPFLSKGYRPESSGAEQKV